MNILLHNFNVLMKSPAAPARPSEHLCMVAAAEAQSAVWSISTAGRRDCQAAPGGLRSAFRPTATVSTRP
jgi:hypothetical protein